MRAYALSSSNTRPKSAAEARIESLRKRPNKAGTCRSVLEFNDKNAGAYAMIYSGLECVHCGRRGNRTEGDDSSMSLLTSLRNCRS